MSLEGKKVGQIELADDVFGVKVNQDLLHEAVRHYLAGRHRGTHKTKDKSEVSGSGRKLWKQKGTGRARIGSIRSPLWRHGGTVHGPTPHSYDYALPKKMILGALRSYINTQPQVAELVTKAIDEAARLIRDDPKRAAQIYLTHEPSAALNAAAMEAIIRDTKDEFGSPIYGVQATADFMVRIGELKGSLRSWKDIAAPALLSSPST